MTDTQLSGESEPQLQLPRSTAPGTGDLNPGRYDSILVSVDPNMELGKRESPNYCLSETSLFHTVLPMCILQKIKLNKELVDESLQALSGAPPGVGVVHVAGLALL